MWIIFPRLVEIKMGYNHMTLGLLKNLTFNFCRVKLNVNFSKMTQWHMEVLPDTTQSYPLSKNKFYLFCNLPFLPFFTTFPEISLKFTETFQNDSSPQRATIYLTPHLCSEHKSSVMYIVSIIRGYPSIVKLTMLGSPVLIDYYSSIDFTIIAKLIPVQVL